MPPQAQKHFFDTIRPAVSYFGALAQGTMQLSVGEG